jgi:GTPase SAR1 family protein
MSCCNETEEAKNSRKITGGLVKARKDIRRTVKLLLLGAGDSGKSTIAKQMKIIHLDGFSEEERMGYKTTIANNIVTAMRTLIHQANKFNYALSTGNESRVQAIVSIPRDQEPAVTKEICDAVASLWQDDAIKRTFQRSSEFQLNDSTQYYFDNVARIAASDYIPTEQDVLRSRVKTTGVLETVFEVEEIIFRLVDVGGQRSERRKWIHCFEDVTAIIFCVAISEYDLKLYEDNETNRMHESLQLFKELCNTRWFENTAFILFLNKKDIFEEKIKRVPLTVCFPDYNGDQSFNSTSAFVKERFLELNEHKQKAIYAHLTCATDTTNIIVVFNAVRDIILSKTIGKLGVGDWS